MVVFSVEGLSAVVLALSQAIVKLALDVRTFFPAGLSDDNQTWFDWIILCAKVYIRSNPWPFYSN